ncbi:SsrA-binding protein [Candidatus Gottesmanbacteria bacterium CG1_02_37_22]|uniref:SsrA-binding protein n=3 Tax=Candidatus Gottesmaniibacteriota TaxID=1752720 RepID=A0A1J4TTX5_9BACT|nr:MAG: SsrA-binding protein [Candidatus Gottesmanbacteria bacterium CG1_02_37_22]
MMKIINKRAFYNYEILKSLETGIYLNGAEVKSIKGGRMSLEGSFVKIIGSEVYLVNAEIYAYPYARPEGYEARRTRKLLLHKKEILSLKTKMKSEKLTIVPLECYNSHGWVKMKIGLAKGKKEYEKREKIKRRDMDREVARELRGKK